MDALESDVNNALEVIHKAERGEKIEYATMRNRRQTSDMQEQLPKHFYVADEIRKTPEQGGQDHCHRHRSVLEIGGCDTPCRCVAGGGQRKCRA